MTAEPAPSATNGDRWYGDRVVGVEPGGNEPIPASGRHGRPRKLFWTWTSLNLQFATIFLGVLSVSAFGLTFWQAVVGVLPGNGISALAHRPAVGSCPAWGT